MEAAIWEPTAVRESKVLADRTFELPLNLAKWIDAGTLMLWVQEEVNRLDETTCIRLDADCEFCPGCFPKAMLSALSFSYLTGVFDADEIVSKCSAQLAMRILSNGLSFSSGEFVRFRRANRGVLVTVLSRILARALRAQSPTGPGFLSLAARQKLHQSAVERVNIARHMELDSD